MTPDQRAPAAPDSDCLVRVQQVALWLFVIAMPLNLIAMTVAIAAAGVATLLLAVRDRERSTLRTPLNLALGLCLAAIVLSLALGRTDAVRFWTATSWWPVVAFYVAYLGARRDPRQLGRWLDVLVAVAAVLAVYSLVQHLTGIDWFNTAFGGTPKVHRHMLAGDAQRWVAVGRYDRHSNHAFAVLFFLSLALSQALGRTQRGGGAGRVELGLRWLAVVLLGASLVVTYVRAAWLGCGAGLLVLGALRGRRTLVALILAGSVLFGSALVVSPSIRAKFLVTFDPGYAANQHRLFLWQRSFEMFGDHPVAGIGWGNYQAVCPEYIDRVDPDFPFKFRSHNLYFNLLAETGVPGLAAFLILFGLILWRLRERARGAPPGSLEHRFVGGVLAGVCAFLVGSLTTDAFYNGDVAFVLWFLVGAALAPEGEGA